MDNDKPTYGSKVAAALAANQQRLLQLQGRTPEFLAYANTLDAMQLHIAMYLLWELKVPAASIPALVPMIDQRWFEDRLEFEVAGVLKELEDDVWRSRSMPDAGC